MKTPDSLLHEAGEISSVTRLGLFANAGLAIVKLIAGFFANSLALIADGINSLTDTITDVAVLIGTNFGSKPPDDNHPYGHGKIETIVALVVDIGILAVGIGIVYQAIHTFLNPSQSHPNGLVVIIIAVVTIFVKEWLFHRTNRIAEKCRSAALHGKAWDHRSDVGVEFVVLAGGIGAMNGFIYSDVIAGLIVGIILVGVGGRLSFETLIELSEGSASQDTINRIHTEISAFSEVRGWHKLRTRRIGRELWMDVHVMLSPELTVEQAHAIVRSIETAISGALDWPVNLNVHIDPDTPEIRSARIAAGDRTLR